MQQQHDSAHRDPVLRTVVGIDVSKETLDCYFDPSGQRLRLPNDDAGIAQLLARLATLDVELVVIEATGRLEKTDRVDAEVLAPGPLRPRRRAPGPAQALGETGRTTT